MNKFLSLIALIVFAHAGASAEGADRRKEFCAGFEEGYRTVKGKNVYLPICPYAPVTPYNSTPFREGIKAGIEKAQK